MKNIILLALAPIMLMAFPVSADVVAPPNLSPTEIVAMCPFVDVDQPDPETISYDGAQSDSDGEAIKKGFDAYTSDALKDAFDIWTPLPAKGNEAAQYHMGLLFYGDGTTDDSLPCALNWLQSAAARGHLGATSKLGLLKGSVDHPMIDAAEASRLLQHAALKCHLDAQFQFGSFLARTPKPHRDFIEAHKWLMVAATRGHVEAKNANKILRRFTSVAELREGNRRHKEWLAAYSCPQ
jgi:TPR repeat protein